MSLRPKTKAQGPRTSKRSLGRTEFGHFERTVCMTAGHRQGHRAPYERGSVTRHDQHEKHLSDDRRDYA